MMFKKFFILLWSCWFFVACEQAFMEEAPKTDPVSIYEEFWKIVSEKFGMFDDPIKNINKEALYRNTRTKIRGNMSDDRLFSVLGEVVFSLKDKHSYIRSFNPDRIISYSDGIRRNFNRSVVENHYLNNARSLGHHLKDKSEPALRYQVLSGEVGYMRIATFEDIKLTVQMVDEVLDSFKDTKGIILDVRANGGGQTFISTMIPAHFIDQKIFVGTKRFKSGPGEKDFKKAKVYLAPQGKKSNKPIVILMDTGSYSATSFMINCFRAVRHHLKHRIYFMGSKSSGGLGSPNQGYLANGWVWSITPYELIDFGGGRYDNGVDPDKEVWDDRSTIDKDEVIEAAIKKIKNW